ncbi:MAG: SCO family protein [Gammaproteobacteria bacterium]|nr:SCO family protein [Gammaproteobacteria bacterium]MYF03045.1 SCO family protein [Gammaproteobacteria bacterium]MYI77049.1 SCO family protein [Gammaproteobacteria bacterium]
MKKYQVFIFFGGVMLAIGGLFLFGQVNKDRPLDTEQLKALGFVQLPTPRVLEDINLLTQSGELFDGSQLEGKWTYAFFGYTNCPDICPVTMRILGRAADRFQDTLTAEEFALFQGMFVSVDPTRDGVEEVREFVSTYSDSFLGITGSDATIKDFAEQVGVGYERIPSTSELKYLVEHQGHLVVFNPQGDCIGYIKEPFDTVQLTKLFQHLIKHG